MAAVCPAVLCRKTRWQVRSRYAAVLAGGVLLVLAGCGGGGSGPRNSVVPGGMGNFVPGVFQPSANFKSQCSSATAQNNYLRSWTNETYLWYGEVVDADPSQYATSFYFDSLMKTLLTTPSGSAKDRFHFTLTTAEWQALAQFGNTVGYGVQWLIAKGQAPGRQIIAVYIDPGSPAAIAGVHRGDVLLAVDGADAVDGNTKAIVDTLNAGLFPDAANETHQLTLRDNAGAVGVVTLQSANVTLDPVQHVMTIPAIDGNVGYLLFNDHIQTAEAELIDAINTLKAANVVDLVLDLRYNGGGYLDLASELAYMIAGPTRTSGFAFENLTFNDKHPTTNAVTGQPLVPTPFHSTTQFASGASQALPTLDLPRVFVITGSGTCSASESIINGLRGVNVEVVQIGGTTCGKPYGFYPAPNCGTTYFSIQFKGVNAIGIGEYSDGFSPNNTVVKPGETLPGCSVADDFNHEIGDLGEARLAATLSYRASGGTCPTAAPTGPVLKSQQAAAAGEGVLVKSPWRENRILRIL